MTVIAGPTPPLAAGLGPVPTPAQRRAIEAPRGPVLVVAGPGAGKTFCLIGRIAHLINTIGLEPRRICAVTFTNKAANEIAARLRRELGSGADEVVRGTLHALCLTLLREHAADMGLRRGFGVADEEYQKRVLRRLHVRPERQAQLLRLFGRHQLEHYPLTPGDQEHFIKYREVLRARRLLDYNDLIALTGELLRTRAEAAARVRARWDAVLVDEFQDLSLAQYEVITGITAGHRHCFAVGDDEQSIYSWAGADPRILERFRDDFEVQEVVLDRNRRCSRQIFEAARRVILLNPALFKKQIEADKESEHCVESLVFHDEREEASWLLEDAWRDRQATGLEWGEYALLYRAHVTGQYLETRCIEAGIPCRLAQGQSVRDDEVIAFVIAALRVIRSPDDAAAIECFAEQVLPRALIEQVQARYREPDLVAAMRVFARASRGDVDARKAWRFIFHVENLAALGRTHETLTTLVDELLSQRIGKYRNPLEERATELSDPAEFPGAPALAERIAAAVARGGAIWVQPDRGVEIPLVRLVQTALGGGDVRRLHAGDRPLPGDLVIPAGAFKPLTVFKALQLHYCRGMEDPFQDYVAFDLETTDNDIRDCEIVEIAAVRVRGRVVVEQYQRLVRPGRPISPKASEVHGWFDADVREQPSFEQVWAEFLAFVGSDVLVAHNGQHFDMPVLRRMAAGLPGVDELVFYDTLPLARSLLEESAKLVDLAHRFGVAHERSHHALDDSAALAGVLKSLGVLKLARARRCALVQLLGWLGLALALDQPDEPSAEEQLLREVTLPATVGRFGDCLQVYAEECEAAGPSAPSYDELVDRLGGRKVIERIRTQRPAGERYPNSVARLSALVEASSAPTLAASIDLLLGRIALSRSDGSETDDHRINLLTLHSTKGLEFSRVYVVGVEDAALPGFMALEEQREHEIQEARRLLYVGMTRAKDRLVLTRVEHRGGRPTGGEKLLREAGLGARRVTDPPRPSPPSPASA